jgi:iron complex outermembrane receptor protein
MGQGTRRRVDPGARRGWLLLLALLVLAPAPSVAAGDDLLELSLEDLMNVEVTSVSKKAESKHLTAAAVTVITAEDLRRGGFTSVPEALRVVPGLQVARIDASRWAISIRGIRQEFSNKLLVMIDGRSLYTPLFGGVVWAEQNFAIEDIERIEVIRGPGGTLWGANAVNGVINIISKKAKDTQGVRAHVFGGTQESGIAARHGGELGDGTTYRISAKGEKVEDFDIDQNYNGDDEWGQLRLGARSDTPIGERGEVTVLMDYFDLDLDRGQGISDVAPPFDIVAFDKRHARSRGGDTQIQYRHAFEGGSRLSAAAYYDVVSRRTTLAEESHTANFTLQHELNVAPWLDVVYGAEYRYWTTHTEDPTGGLFFDPNDDDFHLGDGFVQFQVPLFDEKLKLIAGTKIGGNSWSGFQYQPSGRIVVAPVQGHTVWAALSRAVRIPTFTDRDLTGPIAPFVQLQGDRDTREEELLSAEVGYRFYSLDWMTAEVSLFWSEYEDVTVLVGPPPVGPYTFENAGQISIRGGEIEFSFLPVAWLRLTAGYSFLDQYERFPSTAFANSPLEKTDPRHQFVIRSLVDLPMDFELDAAVFFVDGLEGVTPVLRSDNVRQYARLDLRLGWKPVEWLELSLVGQNLADARHAEFYDVQRNQSTQVPRSGYAKLTFAF